MFMLPLNPSQSVRSMLRKIEKNYGEDKWEPMSIFIEAPDSDALYQVPTKHQLVSQCFRDFERIVVKAYLKPDQKATDLDLENSTETKQLRDIIDRKSTEGNSQLTKNQKKRIRKQKAKQKKKEEEEKLKQESENAPKMTKNARKRVLR